MILSERLEALEEILSRLRTTNANVPILVEGTRDRHALEALGCRGRILLVHDGAPLIATADQLAEDHDELILLLDWDRTGGSIHRRVKEVLESHAVTCDTSFRRELARLVTKETRTVEGLPGALANLRARLGRT